MQWGNMGDEKKKETKIEKKDEFGNTVEKTEIEEKEEDDDWPKSSNFFILHNSTLNNQPIKSGWKSWHLVVWK